MLSLVLRHRQIQVQAGADEAGGDVCAGEDHAIVELLSRKHGHLLTFAMLKKEANQHAIAQGARRSWKPSLLRSSAASAGLRFQRGWMSTWLRLHSSKSAASSEINTASGSRNIFALTGPGFGSLCCRRAVELDCNILVLQRASPRLLRRHVPLFAVFVAISDMQIT